MGNNSFFKNTVLKIALPITMQSLFQASFSVIDQIMTGQLGTVSIAAIGLGGKFSSLFLVVGAAIATVAGILIAQYVGSKDEEGVSRSFFVNLFVIGIIASFFTIISLIFPREIMSIYSKDNLTINKSAEYIKIISVGFIPMAFSLIISTLLRCKEKVKLPLYASVAAVISNTLLNYLLIFGVGPFPRLGVIGAALATTLSRIIELVLLLIFLITMIRRKILSLKFIIRADNNYKKMFWSILTPIIISEFLWSLGENIYAIIYGRIGTKSCAAMALTNPIQSLMIGALTGISSAAGIVIGKKLGEKNYDDAYNFSKKFMWYGLVGSIMLSIIILCTSRYYTKIYNVEGDVRNITINILIAYAIIAPVKVENMILGNGIIRSGGKTKYLLMTDSIGTWCFGIPLGLITAFVFKMPIYQVYFILSLEECVRLILGCIIFKKKIWINNISLS